MKNKETTRYRQGYWDAKCGLKPLQKWDDYVDGFNHSVLDNYISQADSDPDDNN